MQYMNSIISNLINNFIKEQKDIIYHILSYNNTNITDSIFKSFNSDNLPHSSIVIDININMINLCDINPIYAKETLYFNDLSTVIKSLITELIFKIFNILNIKNANHMILAKLLIINFIIETFPTILNNNKLENDVNFIKDGFMNLQKISKNKKRIVNFEGVSLLSSRKIIENYITETLICNNTNCVNKIIILNLKNDILEIEINTRTILKIHEIKRKCRSCASNLCKINQNLYDSLNTFYDYVLSYNNTYIHYYFPKNLYMASQYEKLLDTNNDNLNKNTNNISLIGYLEKDSYGKTKLNCMSIFEISKINISNKNLELKLENKKNTKENVYNQLVECAQKILFFKKSIEEIDVAILCIANIFNTLIDKNIDSSSLELEDLMKTPFSDDNIYFNYKNISKSKKVLIITNDINYVKNIIKAITNTKIKYTLKNIKKENEENCIYLVENIGKNSDLLTFIDHVFYLKINESSFHDYNYENSNSLVLSKKSVSLNSYHIKKLKKLFIEQRKSFKNVIEPIKLLRTSEAIFRSILYFNINSDIAKFIKIYFNKTLSIN